MGQGVWLKDDDGNYRHVSEEEYNNLQGCQFMIKVISVIIFVVIALLIALLDAIF